MKESVRGAHMFGCCFLRTDRHMPRLLGVKLQTISCFLWDALEFAACSDLRLPQCHGLEERWGGREKRWRAESSKKQTSNNSNNVKI